MANIFSGPNNVILICSCQKNPNRLIFWFSKTVVFHSIFNIPAIYYSAVLFKLCIGNWYFGSMDLKQALIPPPPSLSQLGNVKVPLSPKHHLILWVVGWEIKLLVAYALKPSRVNARNNSNTRNRHFIDLYRDQGRTINKDYFLLK